MLLECWLELFTAHTYLFIKFREMFFVLCNVSVNHWTVFTSTHKIPSSAEDSLGSSPNPPIVTVLTFHSPPSYKFLALYLSCFLISLALQPQNDPSHAVSSYLTLFWLWVLQFSPSSLSAQPHLQNHYPQSHISDTQVWGSQIPKKNIAAWLTPHSDTDIHRPSKL